VAPHGLDIGEDSREIKHRVFGIHAQHELKLPAIPAFEMLFELIQEFRRDPLGDALELTSQCIATRGLLDQRRQWQP
jgi:hypothetical protein